MTGETAAPSMPRFVAASGLGPWRPVAMAAVVLLALLGASLAEAATYLEKAKEEIARNDPRTAIIHLRNALKDNPDYLSAHRLLGRLYLEQGRLLAAEDHLRKAQERAPEVETGVHLADAHLQLGKVAAAMRVLFRIEEAFEDHADFTLFGLVKARTLIALNRLDEAETVLEDYLERQPLDDQALVIRAQLQLRTGALDEAGRSVERALDVDPNSAFALWTKVDIDQAAGRFERASDSLDRLVELLPGHVQITVGRAALEIESGEMDQARKRLETLLAAQPNLPPAALLLAGLAAAEGRFEDCRTILNSIEADAREAPTYLLLSALVNAVDHHYAIAESFLFQYLERAPDDRAARLLLANLQLNAEFNGLAIATLEPLAVPETADIPTLELLASAQIRAGRLDDAVPTLERITARSTAGTRGHTQALLALLGEERPAAERHDLARALDHLHYGDTAKAGQIARALAGAAPDDPAILNLFAVIRLRQGDDAGARVAFKRALAADPQHEDARRGLDQLDIRAGNIAAVEERLRARLDRQPGCGPCAIELASLLTADGRGEKAYALLADQAKAQPQSIALREALITQGAAIEPEPFERPWLAELIAIGDSGRIEAYGVAGGLAFRFGQLEMATDAFQRMARALPDDSGPLVALARTAYRQGDLARAKLRLEAALVIDPGHRTANGMLFDILMETEALDLAEALIERVAAIDPPFGRELLATFHVRAGRPDDGIKIIKEALAASADPALAHRLFILRRQAGDVEGAVAGLRAWLIRRPSDIVAMDLLGDAYIERGALRAGLRYYEQALRLSGEDPFLLNDVAWVRHELGMPGAESFARRAYTIAPLPEIADTLGWIMVRQDQADNGLPLLREAFRARPANPDIRYRLAYTLSEIGDNGAARKLLEELVGFEGAYAERQAALDLWDRLAAQ